MFVENWFVNHHDLQRPHHSSSDNVGNKSTISKIVAGKTFLQYLNCFNCHVKLTEETQLGEAVYLNIGLEKDNFLSFTVAKHSYFY